MPKNAQAKRANMQAIYEECRGSRVSEACEKLKKRGYTEREAMRAIGRMIQDMNSIESLEGGHIADKLNSIRRDAQRNPEIEKSVLKDIKKDRRLKS